MAFRHCAVSFRAFFDPRGAVGVEPSRRSEPTRAVATKMFDDQTGLTVL
jgi:hypothetical protein